LVFSRCGFSFSACFFFFFLVGFVLVTPALSIGRSLLGKAG